MRWQGLVGLAWQDAWRSPTRMFLLSLGVAVGTAALLLVMGLGAGIESLVNTRFLGVLPDQVVVEPTAFKVGPLQVSGTETLPEETVKKLEALPGVAGVLRRVRLALPAHLEAEYMGKRFYSDVLVEAIDPALVAGDVHEGLGFKRRPPELPVPVVLPSAMIDVLNLGFHVNTGLPKLNEQVIIGQHFTLSIGSSSFKWGPTAQMRCEIVGVSPRVGVGGPSLPVDCLPDIEATLKTQGGSLPSRDASSVTLRLRSPRDLPAVVEAVHGLGLATPQLERARQVSFLIRWSTAALSIFALLILGVAATGIANGMALMVRDEAGQIGLLRALGASRGDVLVLYLARAGFTGLLGCLAGLVLALLGALGLNALASSWMPGQKIVTLGLGAVAACLAFALLTSMASGYLPARQAAFLDPVAALRER